MKKSVTLALILGVLVILVGCATLPNPESSNDSLVVGSFALDFPDGFFNRGPKTISHGLILSFVNQTDNSRFTVRTINGMFHLVVPGETLIALESVKAEIKDREHTFTIVEPEIEVPFQVQPGCISYLGDFKLVYNQPEIATHERHSTFWNFEVHFERNHSKGETATREYIKTVDASSPWLQRPFSEIAIQ